MSRSIADSPSGSAMTLYPARSSVSPRILRIVGLSSTIITVFRDEPFEDRAGVAAGACRSAATGGANDCGTVGSAAGATLATGTTTGGGAAAATGAATTDATGAGAAATGAGTISTSSSDQDSGCDAGRPTLLLCVSALATLSTVS